MKLVYKFQHKGNKNIEEMCMDSKNLYNQANFIVRKEFIENGKYLGYGQMDGIMKETKNLDDELNYRKLPAQTSQQILKVLNKNWISFFRSIKDWKVNKHKYKGKPCMPGYVKSNKHIVILTNQNCKIKNDRIKQKKSLLKKRNYLQHGMSKHIRKCGD